MNSLGDRMKRYELASRYKLLPRGPVIIRVDGKAFHTFTRGCSKPFDLQIINSMVYAAQQTVNEMSGFVLGYVQSDEASFMITDTASHETQGWFDYELNKLVSITASAFTAYFNREYGRYKGTGYASGFFTPRVDVLEPKLALFDSRAYNVPVEDTPNYFIWRQKDWERNSIQMFARAHFSHQECENKKIPDLHEMLHSKGLNWATLQPQLKNGTFILKDGDLDFTTRDYDTIAGLINA